VLRRVAKTPKTKKRNEGKREGGKMGKKGTKYKLI
jgi:hypothetical protein